VHAGGEDAASRKEEHIFRQAQYVYLISSILSSVVAVHAGGEGAASRKEKRIFRQAGEKI
jgi:hypothetical protein